MKISADVFEYLNRNKGICMFVLIGIITLVYELNIDNTILTISGSGSVNKQSILDSGPCTKYQEIILCDGITSVDSETFTPCTNLITVIFPDTLVQLGKKMFNGCKSLLYLNIPNSVDKVPAESFFGAESLRNITFGSSTSFEYNGNMFQLCDYLEKIIVDPMNQMYRSICDHRFLVDKYGVLIAAVSAYSDLEIPSDVTQIAENAFAERKFISSITFAPSTNFIGTKGACFRFINIKEMIFPSTTQKLVARTFEYCYCLEKIVFPSSLTVVDPDVIKVCPNIISVTIDGISMGVTTDENGVVYAKGRAIWIPKHLDTFTVKSSTITQTVIQSAYGLKTLFSESSYLTVESSLLYSGTELLACPGGLDIAYVSSRCRRINEFAFALTKVKEVHIENSQVFKLFRNCFFSCREIQKVIFPNTLDAIDYACFMNSTFYGMELKFPASLTTTYGSIFKLSNISRLDFGECTKLTKFVDAPFANAINLEYIVLPPNLIEIIDKNFYGCFALKEIIIPSTVNKISRALLNPVLPYKKSNLKTLPILI